MNAARRLALMALPLALVMRPSAARSQEPDATAARDSLFRCALHYAAPAGFRPAPTRSSERLPLMRLNESPGATNLLDALGISVAPRDATGSVRLNVRVTTFRVSRTTGQAQDEVPPRPSLVALADSLRERCRLDPGTAPPD